MLTKNFNNIDGDVDYAIVDLILVDEETDLYTPLFRFVNINPTDGKVVSGTTMQTGIAAQGLVEVSKIVSRMIKDGLFLQRVSAFGTIYNLDFDEISSINWNHLNILSQITPNKFTPIH